jgi:hypothetical protein
MLSSQSGRQLDSGFSRSSETELQIRTVGAQLLSLRVERSAPVSGTELSGTNIYLRNSLGFRSSLGCLDVRHNRF